MSSQGARWYGRLLLVVSLSALIGAGIGITWQKTRSSGLRRADEGLPFIALAEDKSLGVNVSFSLAGAAERAEILRALETAGFTWLRLRFAWDEAESRKGEFTWRAWDEILAGFNTP